uniref:Thiamine pyrimidine synthase n=1 Tax=Mantoniella antarctica TaxID=81844 RepID=A0A7S0T107_9CHLO
MSAQGDTNRVVVALDWTPNGNHLGFYVAKDAGLYHAAGLDVHLVSPSDPEFSTGSSAYVAAPNADGTGSAPPYVTPCSKVAAGDAHFAINMPEGVVGWNTAPGRPALKAVAALINNRNSSAIVTLASSGRCRPKDLDGCRYASYAARFEGRIVQKMIQHDGGTGDYEEDTSPMLGIWNTLLEGKADATWIFLQWEGVEAKLRGVDLNIFKVCDYGMPYAYAPCLVAHPDWLVANPDIAKRFLAATAEGYKRAAADPTAAADALVRLAMTENNGYAVDPALAQGSAEWLSEHFIDKTTGAWGRMEEDVWTRYIAWLWEADLLTTGMQSRHPDGSKSFSLDDMRAGRAGEKIPLESVPKVFTNEYLPN